MVDPDFIRDPERKNVPDKSIFVIVDAETGEQLGIFSHDGAITRPHEGEEIELIYNRVEGEDEEMREESHGTFRVLNISHEYDLVDWENENGEKLNQMFGTVHIHVEGPIEADSSD